MLAILQATAKSKCDAFGILQAEDSSEEEESSEEESSEEEEEPAKGAKRKAPEPAKKVCFEVD